MRRAVTYGAGAYQIVALEPGTYPVTYSLPGFTTVIREGIELSIGFTANLFPAGSYWAANPLELPFMPDFSDRVLDTSTAFSSVFCRAKPNNPNARGTARRVPFRT